MDDDRLATSSQPGQWRRIRGRAMLAVGLLVLGLLAPTAVVRAAGTATHFVVSAVASTTAGLAFDVTVTAKDELDATITDYTGTIRISSSDLAAVLPSDYVFVPGDAGTKTFTGVELRTSGTQSITATDMVESTVTGTQSGITVDPAAAAKLAFTTQPSGAQAGAAFGTQPVVEVRDQFDNLVAGDSSPVAMEITGGTGTAGAALAGTGTVAASGGVATFAGLSIDKAGTGYRLTATDGTLTSVESSAFAITSGAATVLVVTAATPQTAGTPFDVTVTAEDGLGNVDTGYAGTVHVSSSDSGTGVSLPADYTFTAGDAGAHTFGGITLVTAGHQSVTAADGAITGTQSGIVVDPAAAAKLVFTTEPAGAQAGAPLSTQPVVEIRDQFGNLVAGDTSNVTLAIKSGTGGLGATLGGTTTITASGGVAAFTGLSIDRAGTGYVVTASDGSLASEDSGPFEISGNVAQTITFGALPARTYGDSPFTVGATGGASGDPVTFSSATTGTCAVAGDTVTILGAGDCTIHADQAGDATFAAAATVARSFSVAKANLTVTADSQTRTYGSADPSFTFAYGTFAGTDTSPVIDTPPTCSVVGAHADVAGSPYPIACAGGQDNNYAFTYVDGALTIDKATPTVNLTASVATFETKVPVTLTASLPAAGSGAAPTGSAVFSVTGFTDQAVVLSAGGAASVARTFTTTGVKSAVATFAGDANYDSAQATILFTVVANTVNATGVGLSSSSVYPIRDGWRDTVAIRGMRNEPISVSIRIYNASGRLVRTASLARAGGGYSWAWNGRTASGSLLAAGRYRVDQRLSDAYGASRLVRSYVTVSLRTMHWRSATIYASPGPRHWQYSWGYPGSTISAASSSTSSALTMASSWLPSLSRYDWVGVGYQFTLPRASTYRSLLFQVMGRWSGSTAPKIGLNDWTVRGAFDGRSFGGGAFNFIRPRSSMGTSATTWYSQKQTNMTRFASGRTVRAFIDTGGYLTGPVRYTISRVRLVVSYGVLY